MRARYPGKAQENLHSPLRGDRTSAQPSVCSGRDGIRRKKYCNWFFSLFCRIGISILIRYNSRAMANSMSSVEFRALAEFRYQIRHFLNGSERAARSAGLEPQQYLFLLALRGLPAGRQPTIRELAERMQLRHHSAVELVDRLERQQLLRRERSRTDRRQIIVHLTPRAEKTLSRLARQRIAELRTAAPALVRALTSVIRSARPETSSRPRTAGHETSAK